MELDGLNEITLRGYLSAGPVIEAVAGTRRAEFTIKVYRPEEMRGFKRTLGARDDRYDLFTVYCPEPLIEKLCAQWREGWSVRITGRLVASDGALGSREGGSYFVLADYVDFLIMSVDEMAEAGVNPATIARP